VVLLAFFGFFNVYSLRVNLSVAIVAMTENRTVLDGDGNVSYVQDFPWDSKQKGLILSSFFYGYILTQFLGGYIGTKIGGNIVSYIGLYAKQCSKNLNLNELCLVLAIFKKKTNNIRLIKLLQLYICIKN